MAKPEASDASHRALAAIVGAFVALNVAGLAWFGVQSGGDSFRYTGGAARLLEGRSLDAGDVTHLGYLLVLAGCDWLRIGLVGLALIQIAVAAAAIVVVYRAANALAPPMAGLTAAALLACDIDGARWHRFVLTDSLYTSLLTIGVWGACRVATASRRDWRLVAAAVLPLAAVALVRPQGWIAFVLVAAYWNASPSPNTPATSGRIRPARLIGIPAACILAVALMFATLPRLRAAADNTFGVDTFAGGHTIWGYDGWKLAMPPPEVSAERGAATSARYVVDHPVAVARLMLARVAVHFAHIRPFYSRAHNAAIVGWLVLVYALAVRGVRAVGRQPAALFILAVIAAEAAIAAVTHADWDGRYLAHAMPLILVFSGCGVVAVRRDAASVGAHRG